MRSSSSFILHPSSLRSAFTLTEVLIVIGIIVLVIALAVPALALISGSSSINGAENNVSAMLGRARGDAIALQRTTGVFFFIDPATDRLTLAEVYDTTSEETPPGTRGVYLDLIADRDFLALPKGVTAQVVDNAAMAGAVRADDGYIGYNLPVPAASGTLQYGGVILFDSNGRLVNPTYGFDFENSTPAPRAIATLFGAAAGTVSFEPPPTAAPFTTAAYGLILVDREAFMNNGGLPDPQVAGGPYGTEAGEETWLDENSVPLVINRYNGTLVRGE